MLSRMQLEVVEYYKDKNFSGETAAVINQYFGVMINSEKEFSDFINHIFLPGQYIDVIVDDKEESKVPRWRVYEMLNTYFKDLAKVTEEFIVNDDYCDMVKVYKGKDNAIYVKFYTWSCGTPESYTYDTCGNCKRQYNAEYDCCGDYDYDDEEDAEEEVKAEIVVSNKIIDVDFKDEDIIEEEIIDKEAATEENQEDEEEMNNETTTQEAQNIVGAVKDGLKSASEAALGLCGDVAKEAKTIAAMSQQEAENHIKRKFNTSAEKFIKWITEQLGVELERSEDADFVLGLGESKDTSRLKNAIADFNKVREAGEKKGWKKFKELLKAVFGIIFAVFIEVAKIVLKLAFTLAVGVIRVGCVTITTLASCIGVVKDDIAKPAYNTAKKANTERKARKAAKNVGVGVI